jgi:putative flavoprotein involved in K+ transport
MSRCLADRSVDHLVLERREIGDTWATQRWDSFRLNTPAWMNRLLGELPDGAFPGRDEVVTRLQASAGGLPVQSHSPVLSVRAHGGKFAVRTPHAEHLTDSVVVASGGLNLPRTPSLAGLLPADVAQLHVAEYRSAADLPAGAVLVVGSGQSGSQVAEDLVLAGRRVLLSTSRVGRYRWSYRGRELLGWLVDAGYWAQRPSDLPDGTVAAPAAAHHRLRRSQPRAAGSGPGRCRPARSAERRRRRGAVVRRVGGEHVAHGDEVAARLEALADAYIATAELDVPGRRTRLRSRARVGRRAGPPSTWSARRSAR